MRTHENEPLPRPRIWHESGTIPYARWLDVYGGLVEGILASLRFAVGDAGLFDWAGVRERLGRYIYRTSESRFRRYVYVGTDSSDS